MAELPLPSRTELASVWPPTAAVAAAAGHKPMSPMDAIRKKCLDCCVGQHSEVKNCEAIGCYLWAFRSGKHPYTSKSLEAGAQENGPPPSQA